MKHLVLGSSGQVGAYVVRELLSRGEEVIEWDIKIDPEHMDLRIGSSRLQEAMKESDYVHYLASDVGGSKYLASYQDSFDFISNNVAIMDNVFSALKLSKKPFYFTSSQMSHMGHSMYGRLKAVGEGYTKALGGTVVTFWNVYGVETDPDKAHVITDFLKMASRDSKILCRTAGFEKRRFTYAGDVAKILVHKATDPLFIKKDFDIEGPGWISIMDVAKIVAKTIDPNGSVEVYFTDKRDEVQGKEITSWNAITYNFTDLREGIATVAREMNLIK